MLGIDRGQIDRYGFIRGLNMLRSEDYSYVDLSGVKLGLEELNTLRYALQQCPHIYKVVLDGCEIDDNGCSAIFDMLTEVPSVLHLSIRNNMITDLGIEVICAGLRLNKTLIELFLSGNTDITYNGMQVLGEALINDTSISVLGFSNIVKRGAARFTTHAIQNNPGILFVFTDDKKEEAELGQITRSRYEKFVDISTFLQNNLMAKLNAFCWAFDLNTLELLKSNSALNAIRYFLRLDEDLNYKLSKSQAEEKISSFVSVIDRIIMSRTSQLTSTKFTGKRKEKSLSQESLDDEAPTPSFSDALKRSRGDEGGVINR